MEQSLLGPASHGRVASPVPWRRADLAALLGLAVLWGSAFIAIRAGILAGADPFVYADLRFVVAAAAAAAIAFAVRAPRPTRKEAIRAGVLAAVFLMGGYTLLVYWGERTTSGGLASVLVATAPLWSGVIGYPLLPGERFARLGWAGVATGFAGVVLLFLPDLMATRAGSLAGAAAIVSAALLFSTGSIILRRLGGGKEGYWSQSLQFGASAMFLLPFAIAFAPANPFPLSYTTVGTLLYLAIGSSILGYTLYYYLHVRVGPARASFVSYVSPAVGLTLGFLLLGEPILPLEVGGFGLIVVGIALVRLDRRQEAPAPPSRL